jgi:type IX secretion system PorP/SprF family membrane protein
MRKLLSAILVVLVLHDGFSQDTRFSQFYMAPCMLNPAASGTHYSVDATLVHRNQWSSFTAPFKSSAGAASLRINEPTRLRRGFWAIGTYAMSDQGGDGSLKHNSISMNFAHHVNITRYHRLGLGLQPGIVTRKISPGNFQWASQYNGNYYDSQLPIGESTLDIAKTYFDMSAGLVYSFQNNTNRLNVMGNSIKQGTIGLSLHHLNRPSYSFMNNEERLKVKTVMYYHSLYTLGAAGFGILPNVLWMRQGGHRELSVGAMGMYQMNMESKFTQIRQFFSIHLGAQYRKGDSMILNAMVEYANYMLGFAYDLNSSKLSESTSGRGGFEINLRITNKPHDKMAIKVK